MPEAHFATGGHILRLRSGIEVRRVVDWAGDPLPTFCAGPPRSPIVCMREFFTFGRTVSSATAFLVSMFLLTLATGCSLSSASNPRPSPPPTSSGSVPQFGHVVMVLEENHSYSEVIGNAAMPYLNSLVSQYGLATEYFANTHPSIGNYFMLTTGQLVTNDDGFTGTVGVDNIARDLIAAGKTWKSYAESIPSTGYTGSDVYPYSKRHNPFAYFTDVVNSSTQVSNLVSLSQFNSDLVNDQLPSFSFLAPNLLDDAHDGPLQLADTWLQQNIAPLISSADVSERRFADYCFR